MKKKAHGFDDIEVGEFYWITPSHTHSTTFLKERPPRSMSPREYSNFVTKKSIHYNHFWNPSKVTSYKIFIVDRYKIEKTNAVFENGNSNVYGLLEFLRDEHLWFLRINKPEHFRLLKVRQ